MSEIMEHFEKKVGHDELMEKLTKLNDRFLVLAFYNTFGRFNASTHGEWNIFKTNVEASLKDLSEQYPEVKRMLESVKVN